MRERFAVALERDYRYLVLVASMLIFTVGSGSMFLIIVNLKPIAEEFLWPRTVPSLAYSLQFIGSGIGGIAMGYWVDRSGMGRPALLGSVMIGSGAVLVSGITAEWQLYLIYGIMMGLLGYATLFSPLMANIVRWFDHRRGMAIGIVSSGQSVAGAIWPPVFRYFSEYIGWRGTFYWYGLFALATMLPLAMILQRKPAARAVAPDSAPAPERPMGRALPSLGLSPRGLQGALSLAILSCCVPMAMPVAHLVAHVSDLGHASARAAEMLSVVLASSFVARIAGVGLMSDRVGGLRALFIFSSVQAAMLAAFVAVDGLIALYVVAAVFGLGYGGVIPCYPVIVREYLPAQEVGRRTAMIILFGGVGMAIGGALGGVVYDLTGSYDPAFLTGVVFNLGNLAVVGALIRRGRRTKSSPAEG